MPRPKDVTIAERNRMVKAYESGSSLTEVARQYGRGQSTVYVHLVAAGVKLRSNGRRAGWRRNPIIQGRKNCPSCRRWRHIHDFVPDRRTIVAGACRSCRKIREAARRRDPVQGANRREYDRIWHEGQRRAAGVQSRAFNTQRGGGSGMHVPIGPLGRQVREWLDAYGPGGTAALAHNSGLSERRVYGVRNDETPTVSIRVADALAMGMGLHIDMIYDDDRELAA